jgi:pectate lyase-like protein
VTRLPAVGGDDEAWGALLNEFLSVAHGSDGNLLLGWFNVKNPAYGATGDGSTDDTAAIQAAIDDCMARGKGVVYFPGGTYKVTATLEADSDGVTLAGAGASVSVISLASATANGVNFGNGSAQRDHCGVTNLTFTSSATRTAGAAIDFDKVGNSIISNVWMDSQFDGIVLRNGGTNIFVRDGVWNSFTTGGVGLDVQGGNDQYVSGIVMDNVAASQPLAGIRVGINAGNLVVRDCDFIHAGTGLLVNPASSATVQWMFVMNCAFDTCSSHGIEIAPSSGGTVKGVTFTGCWTSSCAADGFAVDGAGTTDGVRLVGHRAFTNGLGGASIAAGTNIRISDSDFAGNSSPSNGGTSGTNHGINVAAGVTEFSVTGCRLGPTGGQDNTQAYGLFIESGASDYYVVTGNDAHGNVTGGISDGGSGAHKVVANNI